MTKLEKQQAIEILRLRSLCRYAASELRALDDIIMQRHPCSSGLPSSLIDALEERRFGGYIERYADLEERRQDLLDGISAVQSQNTTTEEFEDLAV